MEHIVLKHRKEENMKKHLALLLTIVAVISIVGCGSSASMDSSTNVGSTTMDSSISEAAAPSVGEQMYEKYKSIITKLEGENYDGAIEEIEAMKPAPDVQEVAITPENFFDYYDIVYRENSITRDADGKITSILKCDYLFYFSLKDKYILDENENNALRIGVTGDYDLKKIENVDFETGEINLGEEVFDEIETEIVESEKDWTNEDSTSLSATCEGIKEIYCDNIPKVVIYQWSPGEYGWSFRVDITPTDYEGYVFVPVNIQITRAEGTLHIVK